MNQNSKCLIFDIDGTLCPIKSDDEKYDDLIPNSQMVSKMMSLKSDGWRIVLHTSRNMKTYNGNIGLINANTLPLLITWLTKWNIPFDEIYCGKPWPGHQGFYIDDRSVRPREFLEYSIDKLEEIIRTDRISQGDIK